MNPKGVILGVIPDFSGVFFPSKKRHQFHLRDSLGNDPDQSTNRTPSKSSVQALGAVPTLLNALEEHRCLGWLNFRMVENMHLTGGNEIQQEEVRQETSVL